MLVAGEDQPAPGTNTAFAFMRSHPGFNVTNPVINSEGEIAFAASIHLEDGDLGLRNSGIWSDGGGTGLSLIAREGGIAPGTDFVFDDLSQLANFSINGKGGWHLLRR